MDMIIGFISMGLLVALIITTWGLSHSAKLVEDARTEIKRAHVVMDRLEATNNKLELRNSECLFQIGALKSEVRKQMVSCGAQKKEIEDVLSKYMEV
jgi:hypothetical protein